MDITAYVDGISSNPRRTFFDAGYEAFYGSNNNAKDMLQGSAYSSLQSRLNFKASRKWMGSTSNMFPSTNALGSGNSISYLPNYIQIKLWKRLS